MKRLINASYLAFDFDETLVTLDVDWAAARQELLEWLNTTYHFDGRPFRIHQMVDEAAMEHGLQVKTQAQKIFSRYESGCSYIANPLLIDYLKHGTRPWAILSNNCSSTIAPILEELKLEPAVLIAYEQVEHFKPHPEGLNLILKTFQAAPTELVYIGDKDTDRQAATACAVPFLFVQDLQDTKER